MEKPRPSHEETEPEGIKQPEKRREKGFSLLRLQRTNNPPEPEHLVYRRSEVTQETTAERKPRAAGVFLGAEYLSRRRDRKLRRQAERLQKRITEGEKARHELEQIARDGAEQLLIIKQQQKDFEHRPAPNQEESIPETRGQQLKHPENFNSLPKLEFKPAIDVEHTPEVPPSVVLKEVEKAAEFNKPIEDLFEHRAEVKDKSTTPGATPIGNVISSLRNNSSPTSPNLGAVSPVLPQSEDPKTPAPLPRGIYRQAINAGFWIALTLIVLGIIAYFAF